MKRFLLYLLRWEMSTPILAVCVKWLTPLGYWGSAIVANLIGGVIFFWVDKQIFKK